MRQVNRLLTLAFLGHPGLLKRRSGGSLVASESPSIRELPAEWAEQHKALGLAL